MATPPVPEKPFVVGTVAKNSLSVAWEVNSNVAPITHYTVCYRTEGATSWQEVVTKSTDQECCLKELSPDTAYLFRVLSHCSEGQSGPSGISDMIRTAKDFQAPMRSPKPSKPVLNGEPTHYSVPLSWTVENDATNITYYTITYKDINKDADLELAGQWKKYRTKDSKQNCVVDNLEPVTNYRFCVSSNNQKGCSPPSPISNVICTREDPSKRSLVILKPILEGYSTSNSISLKWGVKGNDYQIDMISHFTVAWWKAGETGKSTLRSYHTKDAEMSYTIENLTSATDYFIQIICYTKDRQNFPSEICMISTKSGPTSEGTKSKYHEPPIPERPTVGPVTHHSATISWKVNGDTWPIIYYTLSYKKALNKGPRRVVKTEETMCIVDDLEQSTNYIFDVTSHTESCQSQPSKTCSVKTNLQPHTEQLYPKSQTPRHTKPQKPRVAGHVTNNSVPLTWDILGDENNVDRYTVTGKKANGTGPMTTYETDNRMKHFVVNELFPGTSYRFSVTLRTVSGQNYVSEPSEIITTCNDQVPLPQKPTKAGAVTHNSVPLTWKVTGDTTRVKNYSLYFRKSNNKGPLMIVTTAGAANKFTVKNLLPDTSYEFSVMIILDTGQQSPPSEMSDIIKTSGKLEKHVANLTTLVLNKPSVSEATTHNSLSLTWSVIGNTSRVTNYTVTYRNISGKSSWMVFDTDSSATKCLIHDLDPDTPYHFRVAANTDTGQSLPSEISDIITTRVDPKTKDLSLQPPPSPSKPEISGPINPCSVNLSWKVKGYTKHVTHYTVSFTTPEKKTYGHWVTFETSGTDKYFRVGCLEPGTAYIFRVSSNTERSQSLPGEESDVITTASEQQSSPYPTGEQHKLPIPRKPRKDKHRPTEEQIYLEDLRRCSMPVDSDKEMPIYQVPLQLTDKHEAERIQRFEFGFKPAVIHQEKVILVVGATGAGKSTLINGLLNYVIGVEWAEKVRFRLVAESGLFDNQYRSQTQIISVYCLHHHSLFKVPYTVTIIDTPGFGDTEGIDKDKRITESITHLFSKEEYGIDHIDAIGFVAQSSLARLTAPQKYIFDSILSLFGKDIGENIFLLITFSDSQKPPLLGSTMEAKIPFKSHYKFNNSTLFARNDSEDNAEIDLMFWKIGFMSFKKFLDELQSIEGKSLYLTKKVLYERQQLEVYVAGIQEDIRNGLNKLEQYKLEINIVKQHEADIERNGDFIYKIEGEKVVLVDLEPGHHITNCMHCNRTCHYLCAYANDEEKRKCCAMDPRGFCKICPQNCIWNLHRNEDLKKRYEPAKGEKMNAEKLTEEILGDFYNCEMKVVYMMTEVRRGLKRLAKIALRPNPPSTVQYLDIMINSERAEGRPGFQARINQLENVKAQERTLNDMSADGFDPFNKYREALQQSKSAHARPSNLSGCCCRHQEKKSKCFTNKFQEN